MNTSTVLVLCSPVVLSMALMGNAVAEWSEMLNSGSQDAAAAANQTNDGVNTFNQGIQTLQSGRQMLQASPTEGLTGMLMQRLNVSQTQAEGGAGALFQFAKRRMKEEAVNQLDQAIPGLQNLLNAAPAVSHEPAGLGGGLSAMTGGASDSLAGLGSLAGSFQQLGMSGDMVQRFVPVLVEYVRNGSGGDPLANALMTALTGS